MTTPRDEPARDAWLSEALLHAPDAKAAPSAELSEAILREARNAVKVPRTAAEPAHINPLLQLWSWLARPPVAAGFATLMVATVVGVMWWDKPLDVSRPQAEAPAAAATGTFEQAPAAATPPPPAQDESKAVSRTQPAAPTAKRERAAAGRSPSAATGELRDSASNAAPPIAAAVPEPAPVPAATADSVAKAGAAAQAREEPAERRSNAPAQSLAKAAPPAAAPAPAPAAALSLRRQDPDTRTPTIDQPERWAWQRGAGMQAMTPALQRWLAQLDGVARWHPASGAAPTAAAVNVIQLWRDGMLRATIALTDDTVWLTPSEGAPVMAQLSPAAAASLKAALIDATP
jgi:hypothetical protein